METPEQLRQNLALVRRPALSAAQREQLAQRLPELPEAVVDPSRWSTAHG
jgi:hypothetical protein